MLLKKTEKLKQLARLIVKHNELYYNSGFPEITDQEYDTLFQEFKCLRSELPDTALDIDPLSTVGAKPLKNFPTMSHLQPMLSLDNAFNSSDIINFYNRIQKKTCQIADQHELKFSAEPKLDGISISLIFDNGKLSAALTRGDGLNGELVTSNVTLINSIPNNLKGACPNIIEIRGEIIMRHQSFTQINEMRKKNGKKIFSNPRNAVAGMLRLTKKNEQKSIRLLDFFGYSSGYIDNTSITSQTQLLEKLDNWGIPTNSLNKLVTGPTEIEKYYNQIKTIRNQLDYDIDGVVYKIDEYKIRNKLGNRNRSPRWAVAYKFYAATAITTLKDIKLQVGRLGTITPVAILSPTNLNGVIVQRASLHNEQEIINKDLHIGDKVLIKRAGDVIPQVVHVIDTDKRNSSYKFCMPQSCPECGSPAKLVSNNTSVTNVVRRCTNYNCPAQIIGRFSHFVSKKAFNIQGLGEGKLKTIIDNKLLKYYSDIFLLEENDKKASLHIRNWDGWNTTSCSNLFDSINAARKTSFSRLLYALGIPLLGETACLLIAQEFININKFLDQFEHNSKSIVKQLTKIEGIGATTVESIISYMGHKERLEEIKELIKHVEINEVKLPHKDTNTSVLSNKTILFTGSLKSSSREESKKIAIKLGAKIVGSISRKVDYVIAGTAPGSKLTKAKSLDIKILDEKEWLQMIQSS